VVPEALEKIGDGSLSLPNETAADLKRAKEILSHRLPKASDAEVVAYALRFLLEKTDPLRKPASNTKSGLRRAIHQTAKGQCSYVDPDTGERCPSRHHLQADHRLPRSLGGEDRKENLRLLCRQHNLFEAERILGRRVMAPYWKKH
jgi:hypothetical protein